MKAAKDGNAQNSWFLVMLTDIDQFNIRAQGRICIRQYSQDAGQSNSVFPTVPGRRRTLTTTGSCDGGIDLYTNAPA